jgi:signal transduction histidine kinase
VPLNFVGDDHISDVLAMTTIEVDMHKFNQVVRNLISNALKFSPTNSAVDVYAYLWLDERKVSVGDVNEYFNDNHMCNQLHAEMQVEVHDCGPGISKVISMHLQFTMSSIY